VNFDDFAHTLKLSAEFWMAQETPDVFCGL
jgi:hypothetical protein